LGDEDLGPEADPPDRIEEIAAAAEEFLMVENAALPLAVVLPNGRVAMANRALRDLLGYDRGDLAGRDVCELIAEDDCARHWREAVESGVTAERTARLRRSDGASVRARVASMVVSDGSGAPRLVICRAVAA
jgi:PAS domain S-box-containing protein